MRWVTEIPYESITNIAIVGDGPFGKVYKSSYNCKIVAVQDVSEEVLEHGKNILKLRHQYIIKYM